MTDNKATDISKEDIEYAQAITDKYINKLMKLTKAHQSIREMQQNQENIIFVHTLMISDPFVMSKAVFVIYKEKVFIWLCDESTNYVVDNTSLSKEGNIIFSDELLAKDNFYLILPEMLDDVEEFV